MKRSSRASGQFLAAIGLILPLTGCYSFALHQTAQRLAPGQTSITPGISRQAFIEGYDWDYHDGFWTLDVQLRHGLERFEIGGRISRINLEDGYQFVSLDPKIPLVEERVAFLMPIGLFFTDPLPSEVEVEVLESFQVHPSLIATIPLGGSEQHLNLGVRSIILLDSPSDHLTGINLGLRLTPDEEARGHAVHPEIGLFTTRDGDYYFHWGMALSFAFGGP